MAYRVELKPRADKELRALPQSVQLRVVRALRDLSENPRPAGVKKLAGETDLYRIRVGDYRVVYQIQDERLLVLVVRVAHRRDVYRP
ncbi:MAG: type II toxin-antitoxin system RelE/ParE family toxin [Planctomycetaceae bacterium]